MLITTPDGAEYLCDDPAASKALELRWGDAPAGFIENEWRGKTLRMNDLALKVLIPSMRCVMTTLGQADLPDDNMVLRAVVQANRVDIPNLGKYPCIGVYASLARKLSTGGLLRVTLL